MEFIYVCKYEYVYRCLAVKRILIKKYIAFCKPWLSNYNNNLINGKRCYQMTEL